MPAFPRVHIDGAADNLFANAFLCVRIFQKKKKERIKQLEYKNNKRN